VGCATLTFLGTFARVCLVRPSHGTLEDRNKVYALKILRKTEGELERAGAHDMALATEPRADPPSQSSA
jgi:hypothetical protein